ncbi:MAG: hypothetical protein NWF04_10440 [Candidatus Bathyarchaeota archaeon]|nr:hypothetical protein [Candidatus Bathyarchaeota archaeon]
MKRNFTDLHLRLKTKTPSDAQAYAQKLAELGYKTVGVPLSPDARPEETAQFRAVFADAGLDFVSRVDLRPKNQPDLLSQLRRVRRKFEVVCVLCESKDVARQAAKDRRVDLLNFPLFDYRRRFFDRAEAELADVGLATLEVDVKPLLVLEGPPRVRLLSCLRRELRVALGFHMSVVVSSGASELMLLRKPREVALIASLFGLDGQAALDSVSANPAAIVARNRQKLSQSFVAPGIQVVRQGKQC